MNIEDRKVIEQHYQIIEDLTPPGTNIGLATYIAFPINSMKIVVLKEIDEKRVPIYEKLANTWSPHIAEIYGIYKLPTSTIKIRENAVPIHLVIMEYVDGLNLEEYIKKYSPIDTNTTLKIIGWLSRALTNVHIEKIVHKDIKPSNIIIKVDADNNPVKLKLIDFGISSSNIRDSYETEFAGTLGFRSPESIITSSTRHSDIYSIGCVFNYLLTGTAPIKQRYKGHKSIEYVINKCLNIDPTYRYNNVLSLYYDVEKLQKKLWIDKLPIVRDFFRFRSAKEGIRVGFLFTVTLLCLTIYNWSSLFPLSYSYLYQKHGLMLGIIVPIFIMIDPEHIIYRLLPNSIQTNLGRFHFLKVFVSILSFILSLLVYYQH